MIHEMLMRWREVKISNVVLLTAVARRAFQALHYAFSMVDDF